MVDQRKWVWPIAACFGLCAAAASAEDEYGSWKLGARQTLAPSLSLESRYDGNVYRTDSETADSMHWIAASSLAFTSTPTEALRFTLDYGATYGKYGYDSDDDYIDQSGNVGLAFNGDIARFDMGLSRARSHDDRGTGPTNGLPLSAFELGPFTEPTEYDLDIADATLGIGENDARYRFDVGYERRSKSYRNFKSFVRQRDHEIGQVRSRLFVNLAEGADLIIEARFDDVDYDVAQTSGALAGVRLDSHMKTFFLGGVWDDVAGIKGTFNLGVENRDFEYDDLDDIEAVVWSGELEYALAPTTTLTFTTERSSRETDNDGSVIDFWHHDVGLAIELSKQFDIDLGIGFAQEEFEETSPARQDDIFSAKLTLSHAVGRFMTWDVGYRFSTREGTIPDTDFERNQVFVRVELGL
jgi:hypothetical protein